MGLGGQRGVDWLWNEELPCLVGAGPVQDWK